MTSPSHISPCRLTIIGGGALGTVIAGVAAASGHADVSILTSRPEAWSDHITIATPEGPVLHGALRCVTDSPAEALEGSEVILMCVPGNCIGTELDRIVTHLPPHALLGSVVCSTGFPLMAQEALAQAARTDVTLWGFQRVPYIARIDSYGHSAMMLGRKQSVTVAIDSGSDEVSARLLAVLEAILAQHVTLLPAWLDAAITNSNPLLHTSRIYSMWHDWHPGITYSRCPAFYQEWTDEASRLLIDMDSELFAALKYLPVTPGGLKPILEYYESSDASSLTRKITSIPAFKGLPSPMKRTPDGNWIPDLDNRYFTEDFDFALRYLRHYLAMAPTPRPVIERIYSWGMELLHPSQSINNR